MKSWNIFGIAFLCALFFTGTINAQQVVVIEDFVCPVDARTFMVGTTIGFSTASASYDDDNVAFRSTVGHQVHFGPRLGYFFANNFVLGMGMDVNFVRMSADGEDRERYQTFMGGPFARMYVPITNLAFFGEISAGIGGSEVAVRSNGIDENVRTTMYSIGVGPGITVFSAANFALESMLKYNFTHTVANATNRKITTDVHAWDIVFGMSYYLRGAGGTTLPATR